MKKITINTILLLVLVLVSCTDVFEEDISFKSLDLMSPINNSIINSNYVQFQWAYLKGVQNYRVRVSNSNSVIIQDTLVVENKYKMPISSGEYFWQARGENFAYNTPYSEKKSFSVIIGDDLSEQDVFLITPEDNIFLKSKTINLQWESLESANFYVLEINKTKSGVTTLEEVEEGLEKTSYELKKEVLEEDATYTWRVKAKNETSDTEFFSRTIFVDNNIPERAELKFPEENVIVSKSNSVDFSWDLPEDAGEIKSSITSILEISLNENFSTLSKKYETQESSISHEFVTSNNYYWRVRLIDGAGNIGSDSNVRKLSVQ